MLMWSGTDASREDIEKYGKDLIDLNRKIKEGNFSVEVNGIKYTVDLVFSPDLHALMGSYDHNYEREKILALFEEIDFFYFVKHGAILHDDPDFQNAQQSQLKFRTSPMDQGQYLPR